MKKRYRDSNTKRKKQGRNEYIKSIKKLYRQPNPTSKERAVNNIDFNFN